MFARLVINRSRGCAVVSQPPGQLLTRRPTIDDSSPTQAWRAVLPPKEFGGWKSRSTEHRSPLLAPVLDVFAHGSGPGMILETTREAQQQPRTSTTSTTSTSLLLLPPVQPARAGNPPRLNTRNVASWPRITCTQWREQFLRPVSH